MNPMFYLPSNTTLNKMQKCIAKYKMPVAIISKELTLICENGVTDQKLFRGQLAFRVKSFLKNAECKAVLDMEIGEIAALTVKDKTVIVSRFEDYFVFVFKSGTSYLYPSVMQANSFMTDSTRELLCYSSGLRPDDEEEIAYCKEMMRDQLLRHSKVNRMVELATRSDKSLECCFNPSGELEFVCKSAMAKMKAHNTTLFCNTDDVQCACVACPEDYHDALTAMLAGGARCTSDGKITVKATNEGFMYKIGVYCNSKIGIRSFTKSLQSESAAEWEKELSIDTLYLQCLAEANGWHFKVASFGKEKIGLELTVPLAKANSFMMMTPSFKRLRDSIITAGLVYLDSYRKTT